MPAREELLRPIAERREFKGSTERIRPAHFARRRRPLAPRGTAGRRRSEKSARAMATRETGKRPDWKTDYLAQVERDIEAGFKAVSEQMRRVTGNGRESKH